jgi:hypothetical protein
MVHDFRPLNAATIVPPFLPGNLEATLGRHSGKRYLNILDLMASFFAYELDKPSRPDTAFFVVGRGYMAYNRMPMGLTGSPATEQIGVALAFKDIIFPGPMDYWMDDIIRAIIHSDDHQAPVLRFIHPCKPTCRS